MVLFSIMIPPMAKRIASKLRAVLRLQLRHIIACFSLAGGYATLAFVLNRGHSFSGLD
jgi:hypothetical protein